MEQFVYCRNGDIEGWEQLIEIIIVFAVARQSVVLDQFIQR